MALPAQEVERYELMLADGVAHERADLHLATLLRPGGSLYLVETDLLGWRRDPDDADIADCYERWFALTRKDGNDLEIAPKLGRLVADAGLEIVDRTARIAVFSGDAMLRGGALGCTSGDRRGWAGDSGAQCGAPRPVCLVFAMVSRDRTPSAHVTPTRGAGRDCAGDRDSAHRVRSRCVSNVGQVSAFRRIV